MVIHLKLMAQVSCPILSTSTSLLKGIVIANDFCRLPQAVQVQINEKFMPPHYGTGKPSRPHPYHVSAAQKQIIVSFLSWKKLLALIKYVKTD